MGNMAAMPMQAARMHTPMMMQPARGRSFMQPAQAAKSPVTGLIDIEDPLGRKEELDIIVPVTRREEMTMTKRQMVTNALAAAASVLPFAANAKLKTDEATKKKICAANPTADACRSKRDPNYVYKPK